MFRRGCNIKHRKFSRYSRFENLKICKLLFLQKILHDSDFIQKNKTPPKTK